MKTLTILLMSTICFCAAGQIIRLEATQNASVYLGKEWDRNYTKLKTPLVFEYKDGFITGTYASGKEWGKYPVIEISPVVDFLENSKCRTLTVEGKERTESWIYCINTIYETTERELKIPFPDKTGRISSYIYYRE